MSRSVRRDFSTGMTWMSLAIWAEQAILFLSFIIYARLLGAEIVGVAMMAIAVVVLGETLVRETFSDFLIQRVDLEPGHLSATFWLLIVVALVIMGVIWIGAPSVATLYHEPRVEELLRVSSVTVLFVALAAVPVARLRRRLAFSSLAVRTVLGPVAGAIAGVLAALAGWNVWSLVVQRVVQGVVTDGFVWLAETWRPGLSASREHYADVWRYSSRMLGLRFAAVLALQTPNYAISIFLGPAALALYTAAWRLVDALAFVLVAPVRFVSQPAFAALRIGEKAGAELLGDVRDASSLITFASFAGLIAVAPALLDLLLGREWVAAAAIMQILAIFGLYLTIERIHEAYALAIGRASAMFGFAGVEGVLGLLLVFAAAPYGVEVVSAAVVATYALVWPFRLRYVTRLAEVSTIQYVLAFAGPAFIALAMMAIVMIWREFYAYQWPALVDLTTSVLVGMLAYATLCWFLLRKRVVRSARLFLSPKQAQLAITPTPDDLKKVQQKP
ncbi:MAG: oligosaccharide flippase family protein [Pseudomonadota bacterium]|mgnify:CR=1 FL=1|nr:oligosaccharide flippase family protein [Alphaproteobacteria bacterium]MDZ4812957.1 oligosaccharide flippase family protein [Pseudomonadota bacterium]